MGCHWSKNKENMIFLFLVIIFILKGIFYATCLTPPTVGVTPDDIGHLSYIQYLAEEMKMPILGESGLEKSSVKIYNEMFSNKDIDLKNYTADNCDFSIENGQNWIVQHPPLYYLLMTPIYMLAKFFTNQTPILIMSLRLVSGLLGVVSLIFIRKILDILNENRIIRNCIYILFVFFAPIQFYFFSITNDSLLMCLCIIALYYLLRYIKENIKKDYYIFVLFCAAIIWTKYTGGLVLIAYILFFIYQSYKLNGIKKTIELCIKGGIVGAAVLMPLFIFNYINYSQIFIFAGGDPHIYDLTIYDFVVHKGYIREISNHLINLIGWKQWIRASEFNILITTVILFMSASIYFVYYYPNKKKNILSISLGILTFLVLYVLKSGIMISICGAAVCIILIQNTLGEEVSGSLKDINRFMVMIIIIVCAIFAKQHFVIACNRGKTGAMHGRYYYIAMFPYMYLITQCLRNIRHRWVQYTPIVLLVMMMMSEINIIIRCLETW